MLTAIPPDTEETRYGVLLDLRLLLRLLRYGRRWLIILPLVLVPLHTMLQLAQPLVLKIAVDEVLVPGQLDAWPILLWWMAGLIGGQLGVGYLLSLVNVLLGHQLVENLRDHLFSHLLSLDAAFFSRHQTGRLTNRMANDSEAVSQMMGAGLLNMVADLLLLTGIAVSMLLLSPVLSLAVLLAMPLLAAATLASASSLRHLQRHGRLLQSRMAGHLAEMIGGHAILRLFYGQEQNRRAFDGHNRAFLVHAMASNRLEALQFSLVEASATLVMALLLGFGAFLVADDRVSMGVLVAFIEYVRLFFIPIREIANRLTATQAAMSALERIFSLLDTPAGVVGPTQAVSLPVVRGEITLEQVGFSYDTTPVLQGLSCRIRPGERIAVVGPTGAGKTTLLKLLNRTCEVTTGRILLDGVDVRDLDLTALRRGVGVVAQEVFLFAGTVADNISLGDPAISRQRIQWAARQTGADTFIAHLSQGYDTLLAERGLDLSVGQRQLLGIARTLAFDPPVLVMDEATSAVDALSEQVIQQAMVRLMQGRTTLLVAHRLGTVLDADRILVLHKGRLVEEGSHAQLLALGGLYHKLFTLQFQQPVAE